MTEDEQGQPAEASQFGQPGRGTMMVRCQRCGADAPVMAPFSRTPQVTYPAALKDACEELKEQRAAGHADADPERCGALQRAVTAAIGGRDD